MKHIHKLFLTAAVLLLALMSTACNNDIEERTEPQNCQCETILTATSFTLPNQTTQTVVTLQNDCSGAQRQRTLIGLHSVGDKICD